jgi:hypothetical protein
MKDIRSQEQGFPFTALPGWKNFTVGWTGISNNNGERILLIPA